MRREIFFSLVNLVLIQAFNLVYSNLCYKLTDFENCRLESEYQNSLIAKLFLFKFVNSYFSLFHIAFLNDYKAAINTSEFEQRMSHLRLQLITILVGQIFIWNFVEVVKPKVNGACVHV